MPVPRVLSWLRAPVDGASLAVFRMLFGLILLVDVVNYWPKIGTLFLEPTFLFKYYGFEWVTPWPGDGLYWHYGFMGLAAVFVLLGLYYRVAIALFFVLFSYVFLLDQTLYLNHFYLVCLLAFLLIWLPANRCWALDALRMPAAQRGTVPRWAPLALMLFMEVVLLYAGVVKVNPDWLRGYPLSLWFMRKADSSLIGTVLGTDGIGVLGSYFAIYLHLVGAPLLFFRRTRLAAFLVYALFHLANSAIFVIGIFPFITIAGTLMFFEPDWPRAVLRRLGLAGAAAPPAAALEAPVVPMGAAEKASLVVIALFLAYNVLMPMRPWLYPGNASWTEEGHRFSWRMKLREKQGNIQYMVRNPATRQSWRINPANKLPLRSVRQLATHPDMIVQYAHHLDRVYSEKIGAPVQVFARANVSLNGRRPALLVDQLRDLSLVTDSLRPADYILKLDPALEPGEVIAVQKLRDAPAPAEYGTGGDDS